jgi:arsenate reductase
MPERPVVVFLCVHNAGRSQMAAAMMRHLGRGGVEVYSGGSEPAEKLNPHAVSVMAELGIDISDQVPQVWNADTIGSADVVVTMGCGDTCPFFPGIRYLDWQLEDPAGKDLDTVRRIRDEIETLVRGLVEELAPI